MPGTLILRADGSPRIGTGHVMRCLALAQAWQDRGGRAIFASAELSPALEARLQDENVELRRINPSSEADTTWAEGGDWIVLDGYHFDTALQKHLAECGFRVLAIDDNGHSTPANAHLLLNPNLHACPTLHAGHAPHTELLLGPRFAPLRREFIHLQPKSAETLTRPVQRLLISLGGADPANRTLDVLRLVTSQLRADVHVRVIVGGSNPHLPSLHEYVFRQRQIELIVDARDMAQHYLWADAAILPASTSCLEAFRCGLPCILVASVDNQRKIAAHVRAQGLATAVEAENSLPAEDFLSALHLLINDAQYRVTQSVQTSRMVDGQGCRRILQAMDLYGSRLEPVTLNDARMLWDWANDPEVRHQSFHPEHIPWETHLHWLQQRLAEPNSKFFILRTAKGEAVGQIRLEAIGEDTALIHLSCSPACRGRGVGTRMLQLAESVGFRRLHALVKRDNTISLRMFESAGYQRVDEQNGVCNLQKEVTST